MAADVYVIAAVLLGLAGFSSALFALEPFGLGWLAWLLSAGIAVVCAFLGDVVLSRYGTALVAGAWAILALASGLGALLVMADLRGDYMVHSIIADTTNAPNDDLAVNFYKASAPSLRLLMALLSLAMELGMAQAIWEAKRISQGSAAAAERIRKHMAEINATMVELAGRIVRLRNDPEIFEQAFRRDYLLGMMRAADRRGLTLARKAATISLAVMVLAQTVSGQAPQIVILSDFSRSTIPKTDTGETEHAKNLNAVANLIRTLPPGSNFTVLGITDSSFSRPLNLIKGRLPDIPGPLPLIDRAAVARDRYAGQFLTAAAKIRPTYQRTDILGGVMFAEQVFQQDSKGLRSLVILSDMRQSTAPLDIETSRMVSVQDALRTVEKNGMVANLTGVDIFGCYPKSVISVRQAAAVGRSSDRWPR